jgi:hypothetical protein
MLQQKWHSADQVGFAISVVFCWTNELLIKKGGPRARFGLAPGTRAVSAGAVPHRAIWEGRSDSTNSRSFLFL